MGLLRKNYKGMSDDQKNRFLSALYKLKDSGVVDNFAEFHSTYFWSGIHHTSHFLPWHREMLYRFELELQKVDSSVTIPYWDSTADNSSSSPSWANAFLGQFNSPWELFRAFGQPGTHLPSPSDVQNNQKQPTYDVFWPDLEANIHNPPHGWVGGVMASTGSPRDPAFYLHHCWIDMLWASWQQTHGGPQNFVASSPTWRSWGLNDSLLVWPDRTPADVINYHKDLGYRYDITDHDMWAGDVLYLSDYQFSYAGGYLLLFKEGILGFETSDQKSLLWQSTQASTTGNRCILEYDGNLAIWDDTNHRKVWESNTKDPWPWLRLTPEGKVGIYGGTGQPLNPPWSRPRDGKPLPDVG
jgi:Common central domain of tyrosinase